MSEEPVIIDAEFEEVTDKKEELTVWSYFPTNVYMIKKPEYLKEVKKVSMQNISKESKNYNDIYPVVMSNDITGDERIADFVQYIGNTAWNILNDQGYDMNNYSLRFTEMWMQEHHRLSLMEQHTHAGGIQIVGFYFLETPENCSRLIIHDPRQAKVQINMWQKDHTQATYASDMINFQPEPGMLVFTNSWLQHSFSRHAAQRPIRFIHFNLEAFWDPKEPPQCSTPEII